LRCLITDTSLYHIEKYKRRNQTELLFFAELNESIDKNLNSNEGICKWFSLDEINSLEMPFTAKYVMEHFCKIGHLTNTLYAGIAGINEVLFFDLPEN